MKQENLFDSFEEIGETNNDDVNKLNKGNKKYSNPLLPTSQFVMCGNCFRADTYKGCSFGCSYCFANNRGGKFERDFAVADVKLIRKWFDEAINKGDVSNIKKEFLNRRVPIHLGGLSDPFQDAEWKYGATYDFIKLSSEFNYPVNISTKACNLPQKYWEILDPKIHTFSISILGYSDEYTRLWESHTPTAKQRIEFVKELHNRGFWVSIRIQPIIYIDEVIELIKHSDEYVDYYTIEHLKLPLDNKKMCEKLIGKMNGLNVMFVAKGREYEFDSRKKLENIEKIKKATKVKIGCGDNEFHILSDSLNCCGIDTMPKAFENWFKYNSMYIKMTGDRSQWVAKSDCSSCFNGACVRRMFQGRMKDYTDNYYNKTYGNDAQLSLFSEQNFM